MSGLRLPLPDNTGDRSRTLLFHCCNIPHTSHRQNMCHSSRHLSSSYTSNPCQEFRPSDSRPKKVRLSLCSLWLSVPFPTLSNRTSRLSLSPRTCLNTDSHCVLPNRFRATDNVLCHRVSQTLTCRAFLSVLKSSRLCRSPCF